MNIKYLWIFLCSASIFFACKTQDKISKKDIESFLFQKWHVSSIATAKQTISGRDMGEPTYEFTRNYERIKAYTEPPKEEKVKFSIIGDSIAYPENPKLPVLHIQKLTKDSLILRNDSAQVVWNLYIK